jgi:putative ABC transport system permease protein
MRLAPSGTNFREDTQYIGFYRKVIGKIAAIAGVEAVGAINTLPLSKGPTFAFRVEGQPERPVDQWPGANYRNVTPNYFRAMKIPIAQGRAFTERDDELATPVAIINQSVAARDFAGRNPIGERINFGGRDRSGQPVWHEIVGVAANVRSLELQDEAEPEIYTAAWQDAFAGMTFVIRSSVEPASLAAAVRQAAREVDPAQPVSDLRTMESVVVGAVTQPRFNLTLLGLFGGLALSLSAAGIYGVTSYAVAQRAQEIGVRKALGAQNADVLRLVIRQGMASVLPGVVIGLVIAFAATRVMKSLLFGVSATDPLTFAAIALSLTLVALLACWIPARRAAKVDPMIALRCE